MWEEEKRESGYRIIKKTVPNAKVAGPGLLVIEDEEMLETIVRSFFDSQCRPDIFTVIIFPYTNSGSTDDIYNKRITDCRFTMKYDAAIRKMLDKTGFEGRLYITEWSNSMSNRSYIQDSCYRGTYIVKNVISTYPLVAGMGFWYASDLINVCYDSGKILNGSSSLVTKDGICKPSFYAFQFLSHMGRYLIEQNENYLITANDEHDIYILCCNMADISPGYFIGKEEMYEVDKLKDVFQNCKRISLEIVLKNLDDNGQYIIKQKVVNEEKGSVLDKWIELGCETELLPEDIRYLQHTSVPAVGISRKQSKDGMMRLKLQLNPHEMRWIHLLKSI